MARPSGDAWSPLGLDSDPVPGDPSAISAEAAHLASVAKTITDQVAALHQIAAGGADGALIGDFANKVRSSAGSLAGELAKVVGRYQQVASALNGYVPDLEHAQSLSLRALSMARGPASQLSPNQVIAANPQVEDPGLSMPSPQDAQQDSHENKAAARSAEAALAAAHQVLVQATSLRDGAAGTASGKINSAIHDGMKDSWWQSFEAWVSDHADLLKTICTILEVVGTILAIAAFVIAQFIPGLNILVDGIALSVLLTGAAAGLTALAMVGRFMLAVTHNGSWFDFAMDAIAVLTFGAGNMFGKSLGAAAELVEKGAPDALAASRTAMFEKALSFLGRDGSILSARSQVTVALKYYATIAEKLPDLPDFASEENMKAAIKALPAIQRVLLNLGGKPEDLESLAKVSAIAKELPQFTEDLAGAGSTVKAMGIPAAAGLASGVAIPLAAGIQIGSATHALSHALSGWWENHVEIPTGDPAGG